MWPNPQETADLVTFTEEILNGKHHFLCSVACEIKRNIFGGDPLNSSAILLKLLVRVWGKSATLMKGEKLQLLFSKRLQQFLGKYLKEIFAGPGDDIQIWNI